MSGRPRMVFHPESINDMWRLWKAGGTLTELGELLGVHRNLTKAMVVARGGIAPAPRRRNHRHLTLSEREEISRGVASGQGDRQIAATIGRSHTTVWREINRHGGRRRYRAAVAETRAFENARRPQTCKLAQRKTLADLIAAKLMLDWSPEQISKWLKVTYPENSELQVSHETIYKSLFIQTRGALRKELTAHLRKQREIRKPQNAKRLDDGRGQIVDAISISERPAEAEDRAVPGHWEGDLLMGKTMRSQIATLVERHSRFVMLIKVESRKTEVVTQALAEKMRELPDQLKRSLTWDRGTEMADHKQFTIATDLDVYFCDPSSPWQRGSNENTNGLLRQYFPKGTDLSIHDQDHLDFIANRLNTRPRKTLEWKTPAATLEEALR